MAYGGIADGARLLHHDGSEWVDVTLTDSGSVLCAEVASLSPFAIVDSTPGVVPTTAIQTGRCPRAVARPRRSRSPTAESTQFDPVNFECALDSPAGRADLVPSSCEPLEIVEGLIFGPHVLLVRAVNELGVFDASPARHEWTVNPPTRDLDLVPLPLTIQTNR